MAFSGFLHRDPDYSSLPETVDEQLLEERVQQLRSGNLSVAQEITRSLMRLVMGLVRDSGCNDDELIGEALLTLQESVLRAAEALHDNNIVPYVLSRIRFQLKDAILENRNSFSISARRVRERLSEGESFPRRNSITERVINAPLKSEDAGRNEESVIKSYDGRPPNLKNILDPYSGQAAFELRDHLDALVRSHRQKMVVDLKVQDYTYSEISKIMNISEATAMREIHDLRERYESSV